MIKHWNQELLGCKFSVIHHSHKIMKYVDALNMFYEPKIATHIKAAAILRQEGNFLKPEAYYHTIFHTLDAPQQIGKDQYDAINTIAPPILTNSIIKLYQPFNNTLYPDETGKNPASISIITSPIIFHNTYTPQLPIPLPKKSNSPIFQTIYNITVKWIFIYDENSYITIWSKHNFPPPITWNITNIFTSKTNPDLFKKFFQITLKLSAVYKPL